MKISYNWLNELIDLNISPYQVAEKLTLIGLEVEEVTEYGSLLDGVIVGQIKEVKNHPNADRLSLCIVNIGNTQLQIACGADNVAAGQKVPVATVGTTLPITLEDGNKLTIKKAKLRGEASEGMICSEDELGLGSDHSGIMVLDESVKIGTPINEIFDIYQDTIIDIAITPNRPDATCHLGVARDLAAALDLQLNKPFETQLPDLPQLGDVEIAIQNPEKCHRYAGMVVKDITVGESPAWLQNKLKAIGLRPVNNIVDITNYVMLELGQPLHAFDLATLKGNKIIIRDFDKEITFETLDHVERTCSAGTLFICDAEEPVAIAGVMGGVDSEVSESTENILIESAYFDPGTIRKTAKEQTLQTDASYRFERGIDPTIQKIAAYRAAQLMEKYAGGTMEMACTDVHPVKAEKKKIKLRTARVNKLLGTELDTSEIKQLLHGLELHITADKKESITYQIPPFRPDLTREVDLIEEVGRLYDYNNIPAPSSGKFISPEPVSDWEITKQKAKETAKNLQFREIYSNSLMPEKDAERLGDTKNMLHTLNPISTDMTTLRPSLIYGFLQSAAYNFNRNIKGVRFFEIGDVFGKSDNGNWYDGISEETHLLMGLSGFKTIEHWKSKPKTFDIFDIKAAAENFLSRFIQPSRVDSTVDEDGKLIYSINATKVGELQTLAQSLLETYEIDHEVHIAEFSLTKLFEQAQKYPSQKYEPVSKYPSFEFDFAVIVDAEIRAGDLLKTIRKIAPSTLEKLDIFDVFEGETLGKNKKSLAFRLSFIDKNKTLTINDVEPIIDNVLKVLRKKFSAKLRS